MEKPILYSMLYARTEPFEFVNAVAYVHAEDVCDSDEACTVHRPSDHHMREWPMVLEPRYGIVSRVCEHGKNHPDPDSISWVTRIRGEGFGFHECDGCCAFTYQKVKQTGIRCTTCNVDLYSNSRHDFVSCGCQNGPYIDGGFAYTRIGGRDGAFTMISREVNRGVLPLYYSEEAGE